VKKVRVEQKLCVEELSAETEEVRCRGRTEPLAPVTAEGCKLWEDTQTLDTTKALCHKLGEVPLAIEAMEARLEQMEPRVDDRDKGVTEMIGPSCQTTPPPKLSGGICGQLKETDDDRQLGITLVREWRNDVCVGCC
jgi:hypothetical protein